MSRETVVEAAKRLSPIDLPQMQQNSAETHLRRGAELLAAGRLAEAETAFRAVLAIEPQHAKALHGLAFSLHNRGRNEEALPLVQQAVLLSPRDAEIINMLGAVLEQLGKRNEAAEAYRQAIAADPGNAIYHSNLALMLRMLDRRSEARAEYESALRLQPDLAVANFNYAGLLHAEERFDDAERYYRRGLALQNSGAVWANLASVLFDLGRVEEADAALRRALPLEPVERLEHDLLLLQFHRDGLSPEEIFEQHRQWAQRRFPTTADIRMPLPAMQQGRRLRIGYVSADFREHPIAFFMEPLLRAHDRTKVEVFCYSHDPRKKEDPYREHLRGLSEHWLDVDTLSDADFAARIAQDGIDILVDLGGYTGDSRLAVFALRAAPIQVAYLGYPGTTAMPQMDFRLTDVLVDPPGMTEAIHTERLIRLPRTLACYSPPAVAPAPARPPVLRNGFVTFGVVSRPLKISPSAVDLWAKVLRQLPSARLQLLIGALDRSTEIRFTSELANRGIPPERITIHGRLSLADFLARHNDVDIILDTIPFNGHTTTCHALWMGVPVVALAGRTFPGRLGLSVLTNVGLPDLVATTPEQFVEIARGLSDDLPRLKALRETLRGRMRSSPLMNAAAFARDVEEAFQEMVRQTIADSSR